MTPLDRRRAFRRTLLSAALAVAAVAVAIAVLIGGLLDVGAASRPYWRSVNRSYSSQTDTIIRQSNRTGSQFRSLASSLPSQDRQQVQQSLDEMVAASQAEYQDGAALSPPPTASQADTFFVTALRERADAVAALQRGVFGFLGMSSAAPAGAASGPGQGTGSFPSLSATQAASVVSGVAPAVTSSDGSYRRYQRLQRGDIGHPHTLGSVWLGKPLSSALFAPRLINGITVSSTLAETHQVALATVSLLPTPTPAGAAEQSAPTNGAPANASVLPPTGMLQVRAVVTNTGNAPASRVPVSATVAPQPSGRSSTVSETISVGAGLSTGVSLPPLDVSGGTAGREYVLTVTVTPPPGQVPGASTSTTASLWVSPGTPSLPECLATNKPCQGAASR